MPNLSHGRVEVLPMHPDPESTRSLLDHSLLDRQGLLEPEAEIPACLSSSAMSGAKSPGPDPAEA